VSPSIFKMVSSLVLLPALSATLLPAFAQAPATRGAPLASWSEGAAKQKSSTSYARMVRPNQSGHFPQTLYNEAKKDGWTVISMKNDWNRFFAFE
jgi:hypothetical protein